MTRTVWLASYPKSGNTWFRMLIANLSATDRPVDINDLPERGGIASARLPLDNLTLIDSSLLAHDESDALRPAVYEAMAHGEDDEEQSGPAEAQPSVRIVKAHDAYTRLSDGRPLLGGRDGAEAAIMIVRDPRDIAPSLASHNRTGVDRAIALMNDEMGEFCGKTDRLPNQLRQRLLNWSSHVRSWLEQTDLRVHLVRYEDMQADTEGVLRHALAFAAQPATDEQIKRAVAFARFDELQRQENDTGFREAPQSGGQFFRRGRAGGWQNELTAEQVAAIEAVHAPMMLRLGYKLAATQAQRQDDAGEAA